VKKTTLCGNLLIFVLFAIQGIALSQNTVKLDGTVARTDRVLAKLRMSKVSQSIASTSLAKNSNVAGMRTFSKIPGVVVIDLTAMPKAAVAKTSLAAQKAEASKLNERIRSLKASGLFEYVEPDYVVHANALPTDAAFTDGTLWGLRNLGQRGGTSGADIDAVTAWQTTTGNRSVIVGVIDSGVRYTHQDLAANMWVNTAETVDNGIDDDNNGYIDDVYGINAITRTGDPMDDNDHGTHCAGTIGAVARACPESRMSFFENCLNSKKSWA
jgi:subtilisin family serine protease